MATTITIEIDDQLRHAMLMAKSCYLHDQVLTAEPEFHSYRAANHSRLQALFDQMDAALRESAAAEAATLELFAVEG